LLHEERRLLTPPPPPRRRRAAAAILPLPLLSLLVAADAMPLRRRRRRFHADAFRFLPLIIIAAAAAAAAFFFFFYFFFFFFFFADSYDAFSPPDAPASALPEALPFFIRFFAALRRHRDVFTPLPLFRHDAAAVFRRLTPHIFAAHYFRRHLRRCHHSHRRRRLPIRHFVSRFRCHATADLLPLRATPPLSIFRCHLLRRRAAPPLLPPCRHAAFFFRFLFDA